MIVAVAVVCAAALMFAAGWHLYWAVGGSCGATVALPTRADGSPTMALSRVGCVVVGLVFAAMAAAPLIEVGLIAVAFVPAALLRAALAAQGFIFIARALSWYRYVGLFKSVRSTRFGLLDTYLYSPLFLVTGSGCMLLALIQ